MTSSGGDVVGVLDFTGRVPTAPPVVKKQSQTTGQQPIHVTSKIQEAKLVRKVIPVYPRLAIQTRQFGTVRLIATVGKDGRVKDVQVLSGPAFLAAAAVAAVKQWVYQPTLLNGNPVEVIAPIDVNFVLSQ
jgi:protein TonB